MNEDIFSADLYLHGLIEHGTSPADYAELMKGYYTNGDIGQDELSRAAVLSLLLAGAKILEYFDNFVLYRDSSPDCQAPEYRAEMEELAAKATEKMEEGNKSLRMLHLMLKDLMHLTIRTRYYIQLAQDYRKEMEALVTFVVRYSEMLSAFADACPDVDRQNRKLINTGDHRMMMDADNRLAWVLGNLVEEELERPWTSMILDDLNPDALLYVILHHEVNGESHSAVCSDKQLAREVFQKLGRCRLYLETGKPVETDERLLFTFAFADDVHVVYSFDGDLNGVMENFVYETGRNKDLQKMIPFVGGEVVHRSWSIVT